jgi:GTPase SAR1 family protein
MVLCANKLDLDENREVSTQEAFELAEKEEMLFFEISAKEDTNVSKMFYTGISCLDCFDDIREDYKNLAYDIEYENNLSNESNLDNSVFNTLGTPHIKVKNTDGEESEMKMSGDNNKLRNIKNKCKC